MRAQIPDFPTRLSPSSFSDREGESSEALYRNTQATAVFLDKKSPAYIGGILEMSNARLYRFWGDLYRGALQTGKPQNEIKHTGKPMFEELYSDPDRPRAVHERDGRDLARTQFRRASGGSSISPTTKRSVTWAAQPVN